MKTYEFETFKQFGDRDVMNLKKDTPNFINFPDIYKYKVTIERIDEPIEAIIKRLECAIENTTNWNVKTFCKNAIEQVKKEYNVEK